MSTYVVELSDSEWIDASRDNTFGFITNPTEDNVIYTQNTGLPPVSLKDGHVLLPKSRAPFLIQSTETIFARSLRTNAKIIITPAKESNSKENEITMVAQNSRIIMLLKAILLGIEIIADQEVNTLIDDIEEG